MGKLALWERLPQPVRYVLDLGKIVVGLKGLGMFWALAASMLPIIGAGLIDLPLSLQIPIGIFGVAVTTALTGHVIAWLKRPTADTLRGGQSANDDWARVYAAGVWAGRNMVSAGGNMSDEKHIHVTSHNQRGGITAYQVNLEPGDRVLKEGVARGLASALSSQSFKSISVTAVMGDQEAFRFASQIKNYLKSEGHDVEGVNQAIYAEPVRGQILEEAGADGVLKVIIGGR